MNFFSKLIVIILIVLALIYVKDKFTVNQMPFFNKNDYVEEEISQPIEKTFIPIYFTNAKDGSIKEVLRELPEHEQTLSFAIYELLKGPNEEEIKSGISSELPKSTKLLKIQDQGSIIIVDLSNEFQYGGGTESQYTRLEQLIKTILAQKPQKPVYLYINGSKAEVIGGEGIIITQPLSESSLNG